MDVDKRCPLCGGPNDCGVAQGKGVCWCFSTPVPPEVLARVPPDQRDRTCVCQRCAEGQEAQDSAAGGQAVER
jgi:hypothetical protein